MVTRQVCVGGNRRYEKLGVGLFKRQISIFFEYNFSVEVVIFLRSKNFQHAFSNGFLFFIDCNLN